MEGITMLWDRFYKLCLLLIVVSIFITSCEKRGKISRIVEKPKSIEQLKAPEQPTKIGKDGSEMILIPAGEFQMGSDEYSDEKPIHTVYLDSFYIDKYEVTNAQYRKFMDATGRRHSVQDPWNIPNHPVVGVSWDDAVDYSHWAGKRLPTEAEWEKAARGGLMSKRYPWGDTLTHDNANYNGIGGIDKWEYTSPVGSFAPNGYGLYDMAGNVWEWCMDRYDEEYYAKSPVKNPEGPIRVDRRVSMSDYDRVCRGGSWQPGDTLRVARRGYRWPKSDFADVGFRCAE